MHQRDDDEERTTYINAKHIREVQIVDVDNIPNEEVDNIESDLSKIWPKVIDKNDDYIFQFLDSVSYCSWLL